MTKDPRTSILSIGEIYDGQSLDSVLELINTLTDASGVALHIDPPIRLTLVRDPGSSISEPSFTLTITEDGETAGRAS